MSRNVAVIGAGPSGLIAAHELRREGHKVVVFERQNQVGGIWVYNPVTESDPLGVDPVRNLVHSSLYCSLRTNFPREVMGFGIYPFSVKESEERDRRRFPGHREVLEYLTEFANEFGIVELVRFQTEVVYAGMVELEGGCKFWKVRSKSKLKKRDRDQDEEEEFVEVEEIYDAVVVCVGHYTEPSIAQIQGIDAWPGNQMHSHNYRIPEPFRHQVVVLIGASVSAADISLELAAVTKEVHIASRSIATGTAPAKRPGYDNIWLHSMIERAHQDGSVAFEDGTVVFADTIIHCTGYKYHYPYLETNDIVTVDDNRVGPLYKHIFPPYLAPSLSFVGIPWKVPPFPLFEFQSKWIAGVLSNRIRLPLVEEMMEDVESFYSMLEMSGLPKRYTHRMGESVFEYCNWLAVQCECEFLEEWKKEMLFAAVSNFRLRPETFRDIWEDDHLILQAHQDWNLQ
ncbi:flavin-containing monooxygenase FMO GS-OX-like 5 isoform X1 [Humulus lupulus]|uniref:flavin-containing monooxygenase FMO GS-OX-like 5 isoform X1 n=1 Tax=Humulus lupulus TaxID=3486 RepID=UPI002B403703|nr:flavin-containing monooxygenase FMO GS-OX-like 5 isoform X1 [Humulus lupulus]